MSTYLILFATIAIIYYFLIHKKPIRKTDWESLPVLDKYKKLKKSINEQGELCCRYCGHTETVERLLKSPKENPDETKHYHACTQCKVVLWRSVLEDTNKYK
ncbi:MAG: hypothetical protein V7782_04430 [Psychromonas sp.]